MIGRRYFVLCLSVVCFWSVVGQICDPLGFTDVSSKTYRAVLVLDATVYRVPEGTRAEEEAPVRLDVNSVLKGRLERDSKTKKFPPISVGMFSLHPNPERCVAPLPEVGSRYILFLNSSTTSPGGGGGNGGNSSSGGAATTDSTVLQITDLPVEFSDVISYAVRACSSSVSKYWKKPQLKMQPVKSVALKPGATLRLNCVASGRPRPKVHWYNNDTLLQKTKRVTVLDKQSGFNLLIRNVSLADAGIYRCWAFNVLGRTALASTKGIAVTVADTGVPVAGTGVPVADSVKDSTNSSDSWIDSASQHSTLCESQDHCKNGGTCLTIEVLEIKYCRCVYGFTGAVCQDRGSEFGDDHLQL